MQLSPCTASARDWRLHIPPASAEPLTHRKGYSGVLGPSTCIAMGWTSFPAPDLGRAGCAMLPALKIWADCSPQSSAQSRGWCCPVAVTPQPRIPAAGGHRGFGSALGLYLCSWELGQFPCSLLQQLLQARLILVILKLRGMFCRCF